MSNENDLAPEERNPAQIETEERAFREEFEFLGRELAPWSFLRQTAAQELGLKYGRLTPDEVREFPNADFKLHRDSVAALEEVNNALAKTGKHKLKAAVRAEYEKRKGELEKAIEATKDEPEVVSTYDGILHDAAIAIWLMSQADSVCLRARRKPREYETVIDRWADENQIAGVNMKAALEVFQRVIASVNAARGNPKLKDGEKAEGN